MTMIITSITDLKGKPRTDTKSLRRLNQRVSIYNDYIVPGFRLCLDYIDKDGCILLSATEDVQEDAQGIVITTQNSLYHLKHEAV